MNNVIDKLNQYLADLAVEYVKLHNYHWNVYGQGFFTLHGKLEDAYESIAKEMDDVAERILAIGGKPKGSLKNYMETATIQEAAEEGITGLATIKSVQTDYQNLLAQAKGIKEAAEEAKDYGTSSFIDGAIVNFEKTLWMFNSYLKS
ncbi:DNA starvation/stationary phase protection protein [Clostridia bacterium]|nr:DNA starvation/stationary phase protection protein [Clostridia bacterium]